MASVLEVVAADRISAVFSTHVVAEPEQAVDYLVVLGRGEVLLTGPVADIVAASGGQSLENVVLSRLREHQADRGWEVAA